MRNNEGYWAYSSAIPDWKLPELFFISTLGEVRCSLLIENKLRNTLLPTVQPQANYFTSRDFNFHIYYKYKRELLRSLSILGVYWEEHRNF